MEAKLTRRQKVFIEVYLCTWNATHSAEMAGFAHPNVAGSRLLAKVSVKNAIAARMSELAMQTDEVLTRLAEQARASIGEFVEKRVTDIPTKDGEIIQVESLGLVWDAIKSKGHLVKKVSQTANGYSIELHDSQAALSLIGKHLKMFTDKTDITSNGEPVKFIVRLKDDTSD